MNPPAFQLYADDLIAGTLKFTDAELGLYMRLLCAQWTEGSLPDDDAELSSYGKGKTPLTRVKLKFQKGEDGRLRNARMERVRREQEEFRNRMSERGKSGAINRWHKHSISNAQALPKQCQADAKPMPADGSPISNLHTPINTGERVQSLKASLEAMFDRKNRPWTNNEEHCLFEVCKSESVEQELLKIKAYREKMSPEDKRFFPRSAQSLLEKWSVTLDAASTYENSSNGSISRNPGTYNQGRDITGLLKKVR